MRVLVSILLIMSMSGHALDTFAADTTIRSGFAVVTVLSGNPAGLIATETLTKRTNVGLKQAVVAPSPLITTASILVPVGPITENTTAIAIANPSAGFGGVRIFLTNSSGGVVLNATVHLGPFGQFSKFLNEFFATEPTGFTTPLLLTVTAEVPIAILALNFRHGDMTAIPLTSLSAPTPVPVQPTPPEFSRGVQPGFGLGLPPTTPVGAFVGVPTTPVGVFVGVPTTPVGAFVGVPITSVGGVPTTPVGAFVSVPITGRTFVSTPTTSSIGGAASLVFTQVVAGNDWSTEIAIGNTSSAVQIIRIDLFLAGGSSAGSLTDIVIQPNGVFVFSTDSAGTRFQ